MFAKLMIDFCNDHSLKISSQLFLPDDSFSYISECWGTKTWLDHAVSSHDLHGSISGMAVGYDIAQEDHLPILLTLEVKRLPAIAEDIKVKPKLNWDRLNNDDLLLYSDLTDTYLQGVDLPEAAKCSVTNCNDPSHISQIEKMYDDTIGALLKAGNDVFEGKGGKGDKRHPQARPGWKQHVKDLYELSREMFLIWKSSGMPKDGPIYDAHIKAKLRCKHAIRFIKRHENELRRQSLATKLADLDTKEFWKEIKNVKGSHVPRPSMIDGVSGEANIAQLWQEHFKDLLNSVKNTVVNVLLHGMMRNNCRRVCLM